MTPAHPTLESLDRDECVQLLSQGRVGRVAVIIDDAPHVIPVNYVAEGVTIVFRTADGTILEDVALRKVAFEVDSINEGSHTGWSVCVHGYGRDITDAVDDDSRSLHARGIECWAPGERDRYFKIVPNEVTGRFIGTSTG